MLFTLEFLVHSQLHLAQRTKDSFVISTVIVYARLALQSTFTAIVFHAVSKMDLRLMKMDDAYALWSVDSLLMNVVDAHAQPSMVTRLHQMDAVQLHRSQKHQVVPVMLIALIMNIANHEQESVWQYARKNNAVSTLCVMLQITLLFANV